MLIDSQKVKQMSYDRNRLFKISNLNSEGGSRPIGLRPGEKDRFHREARRLLLIVRVPKREDLAGIARGANTDGYRDRNDRY